MRSMGDFDADRDKWVGFGALSDCETDIKAGMNRIREEFRDEMSDDIAAFRRSEDS